MIILIYLSHLQSAKYSRKIYLLFATQSYCVHQNTTNQWFPVCPSPLSVSLICCVLNAAVSHEQPSPCRPWSRRKGRNSMGWYRSLLKGTRTCLPAANVRWTSLWGISSFLLSTKGSNAMAPCAWTRQWISPLLPRMASWGEHPTPWRWASRSRRRTTIACQRLLEESVRNRKT